MYNGGGEISNAEIQKKHMRATAELVLQEHDHMQQEKLKRKRPTVLEEDEYTDAVQQIIERDFFPDLAKTRIMRQYLEASNSDDPAAMWRFQQKFVSELNKAGISETPGHGRFETPGATPGATPLRTAACVSEQEYAAVPEQTVAEAMKTAVKSMPLDKFLRKFTSEDNAAFEVIFEKNMRDRKKKYAWQRAGIEGDERLAALENPTESTAAPLTWAYKARNSLMYHPAGVGTLLESGEAIGPPKAVAYGNTRFEAPQTIPNANPQNTRLPGREFSLLRSPSPMPGVGESPMLTWGRIDGTPMPLDGALTDVNPFKMAPTRAREEVGLALSNNASARMAKRKGKQTMKSSARTPSRVGLSPAAQRLLGRSTPSIHVDSQLRSAYKTSTPLASARHSQYPTPTQSHRVTPAGHRLGNSGRTPTPGVASSQMTHKPMPPIDPTSKASLTDGLLQL